MNVRLVPVNLPQGLENQFPEEDSRNYFARDGLDIFFLVEEGLLLANTPYYNGH